MYDSYYANLPDEERDQKEFTCRIIRTYRRNMDGGFSYERFDWEPQVKKSNWDEDKEVKLQIAIEEKLDGADVSVVVIKDLLRGVVTDKIISFLAKGPGKNARWYVSSKKWLPSWRKKLREVDLRLFLVPQIAAKEAIEKESSLSCWLTRSGHPSREGLSLIEQLDENLGQGKGKGKAIIVLPKGSSALCRTPRGDGKFDCVVQHVEEPVPVQVDMGGASIFFPALIASMEYAERLRKPFWNERILRHALATTSEWANAEGQRVLDPNHWDPDPESWKPRPRLLTIETSLEQPHEFGSIIEQCWDDEKRQWEQALDSELGIIDTGTGRRQIQLWRSMVEVGHYVCCESDRRQSLRNLVKGLNSFSASPRFHTAFMLVATPGTGKTYLVKRLAKAAKLRLLPFNISQMSTRSDILGCFDTIVTEQEKDDNERLLVFVDEINAELDAATVYSSFLAPIEEGFYERGGKTFRIDPCAWAFAGTENPAGRLNKDNKTDKASDFASRLTLGIIDLQDDMEQRQTEETHKQLALERVYQGVTLLRREFPDVRWVSESVLEAFKRLPSNTRVRDIRHFVRRFTDIQYEAAKAFNVPESWPGDTDGKHFKEWDDKIGGNRDKDEPADIELRVQ